MAKFDHHLHTSRHSPDSIISPLVLIERARAVGLDGVVITDHDYQWEAGRAGRSGGAGRWPEGVRGGRGVDPRGSLPGLWAARSRPGPVRGRARGAA